MAIKRTASLSLKPQDVSGAGTGFNIHIKICGAKGCTSEQQVNSKISGNAFERNRFDRFSWPDANVGEIGYIEVRSDSEIFAIVDTDFIRINLW